MHIGPKVHKKRLTRRGEVKGGGGSSRVLTAAHPIILHFGHAGLCEAEIEHINQFQPSYYQFESMGSAEPRIPWDANSLELQRRCAYWNFRNFTVVDWCNLA